MLEQPGVIVVHSIEPAGDEEDEESCLWVRVLRRELFCDALIVCDADAASEAGCQGQHHG